MVVVTDRRAEQPGPEPALAEDPVGPLEDRDAGPGQGRRVDDDPVAIDLDPQPVLDAAHHDRDDRAHPVDRQALRLAPAQPALDRLGRRDRLADAEADRAVDADAAVRRLLHHADADRGRRELDDDVRRQAVEVDALLEHPVGRAPERRIGLHRQPALATARSARRPATTAAPRAATWPRRCPTRGRSRSTPGSRRPDRGWPPARSPGRPSRRRRRSSDWPSRRPRRGRSPLRARRRRRSRSTGRSRSRQRFARAGREPWLP